MSSMCSIPTLSRIISGVTPALACSSGVSCRCRMAGQRLRIPPVHHPLEQLESVEALPAALIAAFYPKRHQRTEVVAQIAVRHRIEWTIGKTRIIHPLNHGMSAEKLGHLAGIFHVPFHAERHGLNSLQEQKAVKRRQRRPGVSLAHGSAAGDESRVAK